MIILLFKIYAMVLYVCRGVVLYNYDVDCFLRFLFGDILLLAIILFDWYIYIKVFEFEFEFEFTLIFKVPC